MIIIVVVVVIISSRYYFQDTWLDFGRLIWFHKQQPPLGNTWASSRDRGCCSDVTRLTVCALGGDAAGAVVPEGKFVLRLFALRIISELTIVTRRAQECLWGFSWLFVFLFISVSNRPDRLANVKTRGDDDFIKVMCLASEKTANWTTDRWDERQNCTGLHHNAQRVPAWRGWGKYSCSEDTTPGVNRMRQCT